MYAFCISTNAHNSLFLFFSFNRLFGNDRLPAFLLLLLLFVVVSMCFFLSSFSHIFAWNADINACFTFVNTHIARYNLAIISFLTDKIWPTIKYKYRFFSLLLHFVGPFFDALFVLKPVCNLTTQMCIIIIVNLNDIGEQTSKTTRSNKRMNERTKQQWQFQHNIYKNFTK